MGRLVRKPQVPDLVSQAAALKPAEFGTAGPVAVKAEPGDGYLERMVKYVPAEIVAFSMIINAILEQAMKSGGGHAARLRSSISLGQCQGSSSFRRDAG